MSTRKKNQPTARAHSATFPSTDSGSGSGTRPKSNAPGMSSLNAPSPTTETDPELENKVFMLVTAVSQEDGRTYPPDWLEVAHAAKVKGYLNENKLRLFLTDHGRQWLEQRAGQKTMSGRVFEMTKIARSDRYLLKELAHDTGVPMQEAIGLILAAVYENRDALTRIAHKHGLTYPWQAIAKMAGGK